MTLRRALLLLVALVLLLGLIPAGLLLERRLGSALLDRAEADLANAPRVLEDRMSSVKTVRMMHAKDFSAMPSLVAAFERGDLDEARRMLEAAAASVQEAPVLVDASGRPRIGPGPLPPELVEATRRGEMPVAVVQIDSVLHLLALAPVGTGADYMGAVGGSTPFAAEEAAALAGLTRSEVVILKAGGEVAASTVDLATALVLADHAESSRGAVYARSLPAGEVLVTASPVDEGEVLFLKDVDRELAILPQLRRTALVTTAAVLAFALLVGALFAGRLAAPVSQLADAAEDFGAGRPELPLHSSSILEVRRLAGSFGTMRETLARRLTELEEANAALADANAALEEANQALEDRQTRLATLQSELVQRERLASSGRLLAQLAHEIRNPVASVRNCLEVVRRRGRLEGEAAEFADMAVEELLRMHELAERMLDLHRPRERGQASCDAAAVARETVLLVRAGAPDRGNVSFSGGTEAPAAIPPDDLKQVLLNLVLNAVEAAPAGSPVEIVARRENGRVRLEVLDRGPGLAPDVGDRIFDPFFTTKDEVHGVGLGLYTAEGLVRAAGGTLSASNRDPGPGARFVVELRAADVPAATPGTGT